MSLEAKDAETIDYKCDNSSYLSNLKTFIVETIIYAQMDWKCIFTVKVKKMDLRPRAVKFFYRLTIAHCCKKKCLCAILI